MPDKTTIQISLSTKKALIERGKKTDSYDDIIQELLRNVPAGEETVQDPPAGKA